MANVSYGISPTIGANRCKMLTTEVFEGVKYYAVVLSVLEYPNARNGLPYAEEGAREIIENSPSFNRQIQEAQLRGECGHPKFEAGMDEMSFVNRVNMVYETNEMLHIMKVWIAPMQDENGNTYPAIWGWITPTGVHKDVLREKLENPNENVSFSLRGSSVVRIINGRQVKWLTKLITWDYVTEPGIRGTWKFNSRPLNSVDLESNVIYMDNFEVNVPYAANDEREFLMAMESKPEDREEYRAMFKQIRRYDTDSVSIHVPRYLQ